MAKVRKAAQKLSDEGKIDILRGGVKVEAGSKWPIRLKLKDPGKGSMVKLK